MTDVFEQAFFWRLADLAESRSLIDQDLYQKYDVKRGLRYVQTSHTYDFKFAILKNCSHLKIY